MLAKVCSQDNQRSLSRAQQLIRAAQNIWHDCKPSGWKEGCSTGSTVSSVNDGYAILTISSMLECLLDSKIVTTRSLSLNTYAPKATVVEWEYDRLSDPFETALCQQLNFSRDVSAFDQQFKDAMNNSIQLGAWCSDQVWRYSLEEQEFHKILRKYERLEPIINGNVAPDKTIGIEKLKRVEEMVKLHHFSEPKATREYLSSKVLLLYHKLCEYFESNEITRCLIFVDQRITARVLHDLFCRLDVPNLRSDIFLGVGSSKSGHAGVTGPQVRDLKMRFESGFVNCLFCTSVAEEGIDSPECNLVIRFDLYNTMIQYVQSRGRARARGSVYGQMVERGNALHKVKVDDAHYHELQLRHFLSHMEEDRFMETESLGVHGAFIKEKPNKTFRTSAGTRCNYRTGTIYLNRYASSLQYENPGMARVVFEPEIANGMFKFRTVLPDGSPVKGAVGEPFPNKTAAKQSAAWETCVVLRSRGLLDDNLNSVFFKQRPANANAKLAVFSGKKDEYDMLVKPEIWTMNCGQMPSALFATVIYIVPSSVLRRSHDPLVLLTRSALPSLPEFPVYLDGSVETKVAFAQRSSPYPVEQTMLRHLKEFTLQVFQDLFNKEYDADETQMPYWLAPTKWRPGHNLPQNVTDLIDNEAVGDLKPVQWSSGSDPNAWCDQFLIDKWSGKYRYWSNSVLHGLSINSPIPTDVPDRRFKGAKAEKIMEYTLSLYGTSKLRFLEACDQSQPVLGAELVQIRRNFLDKANAKDFEDFAHEYHICSEPLAVSKLPHGLITTALVFPAIMSRMDSYLLATEACQKLQLDVAPELALEAITKDADNTEEHREQQIHFQRGMGKNYERLEFLGDSFLKMTTTIMVFIRYPKSDELGFHVKRMEMICNLNLFNVAVDPSFGLTQYVRTSGFNRRYWYPEGMVLRGGKGALHAEMKPVKHGIPKHALAQKTIADVSEALIGAALLSAKEPNDYEMAIRAVTKLVNSKDHDIQSWSDYSRLYQPPSWSIDTSPDGFTHGIDSRAAKIQDRMDYTFRHPRLLRSAMTHPSYTDSIVPDYQRLEFLGDSILDMVCIRNLYDRFPNRDPQWLTEHKMAMVSNKFLGAVAVDLDFDKYLYYSGVHIPAQISSYAIKIREALPAAKQNNHIDFWTEIEDPPKCLSDTVESYIGAVFVDSDFNYAEVERFFHNHISWYFSDMAIYDTFANKHPTTELHNILTKQYKCRQYRLITSNPTPTGLAASVAKASPKVRVGVIIHREVAAYAEGSSTKYAKVRASKVALQRLKGMSMEVFRDSFRCACREKMGEVLPVGGGEEVCAL
jgi:endoribonuclease Dicer